MYQLLGDPAGKWPSGACCVSPGSCSEANCQRGMVCHTFTVTPWIGLDTKLNFNFKLKVLKHYSWPYIKRTPQPKPPFTQKKSSDEQRMVKILLNMPEVMFTLCNYFLHAKVDRTECTTC